MGATFDAHDLVRRFKVPYMESVQLALSARNAAVLAVASNYVARVQDFQQSLREEGLADHLD